MADLLITVEWIDHLLNLASVDEQTAFLAEAGAANAAGVEALLNYAEETARHQPQQAQQLTHFCEAVAQQISADELVPRARYLRAQTHVLSGEPEIALNLIQQARDQFIALSMTVDALRTDLGLMNTYTVMGNYAHTLEIGYAALAQIDDALAGSAAEMARSLQILRAKIYVTLGPALSETGRFDEALAAYEQAEAIYKSLQMTEDLALVLSNRGVALRYLGRVDEALVAYEQAAQLSPAAGYFHALTLTNIGDAQMLLGNYQASLSAYDHAMQAFTAQGINIYHNLCASHLADAYLALNLFTEAQSLYQEVVDSLASTEFHYYRGKALWGMGAALKGQLNMTGAIDALTQAANVFTQLENTPLHVGVLLELVAVNTVQGDREAALARIKQVFDLLGESEEAAWPVQQIYAHLRMADLVLPDVNTAEGHLSRAETLLQDLSLPHLRYRLLQRQGHLRRMQNRYSESQALLEAAIVDIERLRGSLVTEAFRISFQQDKIDAYQELILLYLAQIESVQSNEAQTELSEKREAAIERTFDLIERAKSRALVERMSGVVNTFLDERDDQEGQAQVHRLQARLNAIYSDLLGQGTDDADEQGVPADRSVRMAQLHRQATQLESELARLRLRAATPAGGEKPETPVVSISQIGQLLTENETILSYHVVNDEILAFVITKESAQVVRHVSTSAHIQPLLANLDRQWRHLQGRQSFVERHLSRLEQNAQHLLLQLFQALLAPVEQLWEAAMVGDSSATADSHAPLLPKLIIVPHGVLHQVPFQALFDGTRYLIERALISYAPSVTVYGLCQSQSWRSSEQLLALAVSDPAIPAVEAESNAIAQSFPNAVILLNEEATAEALARHIGQNRVLHFACHGLYREDNPMFSAIRLYDGWLTAVELSQLDLTGAMVVLSACESGRGVILAGDEMMGLARAGLSAGANGLMVSQWLVQDDTGAMLMAEWYARLARGQSAAMALRAAQRSLMSSHPHPYYWAPFILVGNENKIF